MLLPFADLECKWPENDVAVLQTNGTFRYMQDRGADFKSKFRPTSVGGERLMSPKIHLISIALRPLSNPTVTCLSRSANCNKTAHSLNKKLPTKVYELQCHRSDITLSGLTMPAM